MENKQLTLKEAVKLVRSGDTLAIGGNTLRRHPIAFIHEIIRNKITGLTLQCWVSGLDVDLLVGAGCVKKIEAAYVGLGPLGLAPNVRRAIQEGKIEYWDYSETSMIARFRAGGSGLPFLPTKALLGTSMAEHGENIKEITCPFTGQKLHAVSAVTPDVVIIHGYMADEYGNIQSSARRNTDDIDVIIAKSGKKVICTVEKILTHEAILQNSTFTYIPHHWVDAVVEVPYGAYPGSCDGYYDYDEEHLQLYLEKAKTAKGFEEYLEEYVYEVEDHWQFLNKCGGVEKMYMLRGQL